MSLTVTLTNIGTVTPAHVSATPKQLVPEVKLGTILVVRAGVL